MEINTIGKSKGSFKPDEVRINLTFKARSRTYDEVLNIGNKSIDDFVNEVLIKLGFSKNDLQIRNLIVNEETKYNNQTNSYDLLGYLFESEALLKFPYDKDLIALFLKLINKRTNSPQFILNFGLIDEEKYRNELIEKAYLDSLDKATVIGEAANKKIVDVLKVSFQPLDNLYSSNTSFDTRLMYMKHDEINSFVNYLNPMDIELEEIVYSLFKAE